MLKMADMKLVTCAGERTRLSLSTLGMARNATFAAKSTVPCGTHLAEVKVFGRWADDPAELPPFGLNFTKEFPPPKKELLFNASTNKGRLVLTCSDKR